MDIDIAAFTDELQKISEARDDLITRERALRALKGALGAGAGYGIGWGLGKTLMASPLPEKIRQMSPHPVLLGVGGAGLGLLSSMANQNMRRRFLEYVRAGDGGAQ